MVTEILNTAGSEEVLKGLNSAAQFSNQEYSVNTIIDILNKASSAEWDTIAASFPDLGGVIDQARNILEGFNNFFGLNIANSPWFSIRQFWSEGAYILMIAALLIPILAGLTQWISVRLMPQAAAGVSTGEGGSGEDMVKSMRMVNNIMPLMSIWFCFFLPVGVGIYWVMSAVVRMIQQIFINKYLEKVDIDEEIKKNIEKYNRKREKDGLPPERLNNVARANTRTVETKKREITSEERQKQIQDSTEYYKRGEAKPGSLAAKARMVEQYNEKNKKK